MARMALGEVEVDFRKRFLLVIILLTLSTTIGCNLASISTRVNENNSGTNTVIVAVPNKGDCPSLLTTGKVEDGLKQLRTEERNLGNAMDYSSYTSGGLIGFRILYPFNTPEQIPLQFTRVQKAMNIPSHIQMPMIDISPVREDAFQKTWSVKVTLNSNDMLFTSGDCPVTGMTYAVTMPERITSFSPNTDQTGISVRRQSDTTVEWTLQKQNRAVILQAQAVRVKAFTPTPIPPPSITPTASRTTQPTLTPVPAPPTQTGVPAIPTATSTPFPVPTPKPAGGLALTNELVITGLGTITALIGLIVAIIKWRSGNKPSQGLPK